MVETGTGIRGTGCGTRTAIARAVPHRAPDRTGGGTVSSPKGGGRAGIGRVPVPCGTTGLATALARGTVVLMRGQAGSGALGSPPRVLSSKMEGAIGGDAAPFLLN
jgi:hypothetical protein